MDKAKQAAFVRTMRMQKFSKGGMIRRLGDKKYFASGGLSQGLTSNLPDIGSTPDPTLAAINNSPTQGQYTPNAAVNNPATNPNTGVLGTIAGGLGLNNQFQANSANIQAGTNAGQLGSAYAGNQSALGNQQNLVSSLSPQVQGAVGNQNSLANQYLAMSRGQGPNPAQAELAQATNQNVNQQAALMAGQRGASSNVGLAARQIAQQGANTQQQSAGQAATLEAQQQIAAQNNLANLTNNQISQAGQAATGLTSGQQNEQGILQNANTSYNNAAVGQQSNINSVDAQTSAANQNMGSNLLGGLTGGLSSVSSIFAKGGEVKPHHVQLAEMNAVSLSHAKKFDEGGTVAPDLGSLQSNATTASNLTIPPTEALPTNQKSSSGGGIGGAIKGIAGIAAMFDQGGPIVGNPLISMQAPNSSVNLGGGQFQNSALSSSGPNVSAPGALPENETNFSDIVSKAMSGKKKDSDEDPDDESPDEGADESFNAEAMAHGGQAYNPHHFHEYFAEGGKVPAMVSPGEIYLSPKQVHEVATKGFDPAKIGHKFSGKAKVKGDSLKNDNIPATLEEGGIVIDRKNMGSREKRELFVHKTLAKHKVSRGMR